MTEYLWEVRSTGKRHGRPKLYPQGEMEGLGGFISLFGLGPVAAEYVDHTGATRGLGKFPLYADTLKLDFDDAPEAQERAKEWLIERSIGHTVYDTGNRGQHIHIPIEPMERVGLAHYFEAVVKNVFPGADYKIYKPTGVIRIPGTYHAKTGKKMAQISCFKGALFQPKEHYKLKYIPVKQLEEVDTDMLDFWFTRDLNKRICQGDRNTHIFHLAATAMRIGIDRETAETLIAEWNSNFCIPSVRDGEMMSTIRSAYRR